MSVKNQHITNNTEFQQLFGEFNVIRSDMTEYQEFLARRRRAIETMVEGGSTSLN
jgi:hypothetical protein